MELEAMLRNRLSKRTRHIEVHHLWLQQRVDRGEVTVEKVAGDKNPADLFTKYLAVDKIANCSKKLGSHKKDGRHALAPKE